MRRELKCFTIKSQLNAEDIHAENAGQKSYKTYRKQTAKWHNLSLSVVTLNVKGLTPIKRQIGRLDRQIAIQVFAICKRLTLDPETQKSWTWKERKR